MQHFLLLLKSKEKLDYSPEQLQKRLEEYRVWADKMEGVILQDNRLEPRGHLIEGKETIHSDGPFLETKELIAGFIIIQASDLEQASNITLSSPLLKYFHILVRPMVMP